LVEIIEKMSTAPASILNIEAGSLKAGVPADIAIIDTELEWTVDSSAFYTKGKHTPFDKKILKGKAVATIVSGKFVMRKGKVCI